MTDFVYDDDPDNQFSWQKADPKTLTYAGGTTNGVGDYNGTGDPATLFTVTGDVIVKIIAVVTTNLAGATATVEVGTAAVTDAILPTTLATTLDARLIWHDAAPSDEIEAISTAKEYIITDGNDIVMETGIANVTSGVIVFYCYWQRLSTDGQVVVA